MRRTKYQRAMDDIHCPAELVEHIKQQSVQENYISETNDYYIYLHKKKPFRRFIIKAAILCGFFIPALLLGRHIHSSFNNENPVPSIQGDNLHHNENPPADSSLNELELSRQELDSFLTKNYPDFRWNLIKKEEECYYELWNDKNKLRITINPKEEFAVVEHNNRNLEVSLPYGFLPNSGNGVTSMYLHDTIGNGSEQLVVISSVIGTMGTTWDFDIYDLATMIQIPIQEDIPWLASQIDFDILSYYDEHLTYTLTVPNNTTYLMSDYVGEADEFYRDDLKYDPLSLLTNGIGEIMEYTLSEDALEQAVYELKAEEPGLRITYSITPYFMWGSLYCGQIATEYEFDGEKFILVRNRLNYLQPNADMSELSVDAKEYQCPMNTLSSPKFSTWYLSGSDNSTNRLLIQLMKKAEETPWVIDTAIITNGTKIPLKQLENKTNIRVLWSQTGESMAISYQHYQPLPAYDRETFFVYDISENKVVYEDAFTFESMKEAFGKQGIYFMAFPSGEARESFKIRGVDEKKKLLTVEYSFTDQNQYQRQGSFTYNYETGEYKNLAKDYQELTDQFNYWNDHEIGEDYKEVIITKLEAELAKQAKLDTEMLSYLSLKVTEWNDFSMIEYRENPEIYGVSARGSYLIVWKPEYAKLIEVHGSLQVEEVVQIKEKEYIIIANDYKFSNQKGIRLIRLTDKENEIEISKVAPDNLPKGYTFDGSVYSNTGDISYTIEGSTIILNQGKNEYRITF